MPLVRNALSALKDHRAVIHQAKLAVVSHVKAPEAECPICGFTGKFLGFGDPVRTAAQCRKCWSLERHRLLSLVIQRGAVSLRNRDVLNFTADHSVGTLAADSRTYRTSNYPTASGGDFAFNIEQIDLPDESYDVVICSHVLEHVNDRMAFAEVYRILRPGGQFVFMIPIVEGWSETYENPAIVSEQARHIHFGQFDHVRYYGSDVRQRAAAAGFQVSEYCGSPADCIKYGLMRGEKVFIATKP